MNFFLESSDRNCTRNIIYSTVNMREHYLERIATVASIQRACNTRSTSSSESSENMQWDIRKIECCEDQISDNADLEKQLDNFDGNLKKSRDEAWKVEKAAVKGFFKKGMRPCCSHAEDKRTQYKNQESHVTKGENYVSCASGNLENGAVIEWNDIGCKMTIRL